MLTAAEGDLANPERLCIPQRPAHDGQRLRLSLVFRRDEVGPFKQLRGQLIGVHELLNLHSRCGGHPERPELRGVNLDESSSGIFIALDDVCALYFTPVIHVAVMNALMRAAVDLMKLHLPTRRAGGVDFDPDRDKGDLEKSGPGRSSRHIHFLTVSYETRLRDSNPEAGSCLEAVSAPLPVGPALTLTSEERPMLLTRRSYVSLPSIAR